MASRRRSLALAALAALLALGLAQPAAGRLLLQASPDPSPDPSQLSPSPAPLGLGAPSGIPAPAVCYRRGATNSGDPYANEVIADPSVSCANGTVNNYPYNYFGYDNAPKEALYCPACYLYKRHSEPAQNSTQQFVETNVDGGQRLVLPVQPCRGVEDWNTTGCGGDAAWNFGFAALSGADKGTYGQGVNPTHRRTQHQLHIHVAPAYASLLAALKAVPTGKGWLDLNCTGPAGKTIFPLNSCSLLSSSGATKIQAKAISAQDPAAAQPFEEVYGADPDSVHWVSMGVFSPRQGTIVLVRAADRQSECMLDCASCHC